MVNLTHYKMLISKKNEVNLKLTSVEPSVAAELNDFFTFEVPGFKYMPAYRNKMWDGKIRLYNIVTGEIYVGLLPYIEEYLKNNGEHYELQDGLRSERTVARSVVQGFVRGLDPPLMDEELKYEIIRLMPLPMLLPQIVLCLFLLLLPVSR